MERALAALAGSGLDTTRFTVIVEPPASLAQLDRSMTAVLAVGVGGLGAVLEALAQGGVVAWVVDRWADPHGAPEAEGEAMTDWRIGTVAELRADQPVDVVAAAGWLVVDAEVPTEVTDAELLAAVEEAIGSGASPSRAAKAIAADYGVPKRRVYDLALSVQGQG